jgi:hypothetical protein
MTREIVGDMGLGLPRKVGGRANHGGLQRSHHPDGNHVGRQPVLRSNSGVEALRHDIDGRLARLELEMNLRIGRQEALPDRCDHPLCRRMHGVDPQTPEGPASLLVQVLQGDGDLIDRRSQPLQQTKSGVGQ